MKAFSSEERPGWNQIAEGEGYVVTYDPLDGSSIIDTNFSIGSIFSIWKTGENKLLGSKVKDQVNAVITIFGPRTTAVYYNEDEKKVQELTSIDDYWIISHDNLVIKEKAKIFCPGNLRAAGERNDYNEVVNNWITKGMTLRYTGGLVLDIYQLFIKGQGIFINLASKSHKAKLRGFYEVASLGYLTHKAGGDSVTNKGISLLEYQLNTYDDRLPFALGSKNDVESVKHLFA